MSHEPKEPIDRIADALERLADSWETHTEQQERYVVMAEEDRTKRDKLQAKLDRQMKEDMDADDYETTPIPFKPV